MRDRRCPQLCSHCRHSYAGAPTEPSATSQPHAEPGQPSPEHSCSILVSVSCRDSLIHASMSCRLRLSLVTDVEYTFTAIFCHTEPRLGPPHPLTPQPHRGSEPRTRRCPPRLPAPHPLGAPFLPSFLLPSSLPCGANPRHKATPPRSTRRGRSTAQGPRPSLLLLLLLLPPPPPPRGPRGGARPGPGPAPHTAPELPAPADPARPHPPTPAPRPPQPPGPSRPVTCPASPRLLRVQTGPARCPGPRHAHAARSRHPRDVTEAAAQEERRARAGEAGPSRGSAHRSECSLVIGGSR